MVTQIRSHCINTSLILGLKNPSNIHSLSKDTLPVDTDKKPSYLCQFSIGTEMSQQYIRTCRKPLCHDTDENAPYLYQLLFGMKCLRNIHILSKGTQSGDTDKKPS